MNVTTITPEAIYKEILNNEIKLIETPSQFTIMEYYMLMKNSISPFNNKIVRQAINHAIDRR